MKTFIMKIFNFLKWLVMLLIALLLILLIVRFLIQQYTLSKSTKNNEVSQMVEVSLNNINQKVLIEGKKKDLPILVILHGGPEVPIPFGNGYRGVYKDLVKNYIVVQWDQYGCGNNKGNYNDLTINDYVIMSEDLIKYLKKNYPKNEIYLFGMSWGTVLGTYLVNKIPGYIDKYISYGTFTNMQTAYNYLGEQTLTKELSDGDREEVNKLMKEKYNYENAIKLQEISLKYGLSIQGTDKSDSFIYQSLAKILFSPDYSLGDIYGLFTNNIIDSKIYKELNETDILNMLKNIDIPVYIIQGKYDEQTPHYIINDIVSSKGNFNYLELENSGHSPTKKDFKVLLDYLISLKS